MNIALFGATGTIGQRILKEALDRGHRITAIVRDLSKLAQSDTNLRVVKGDVSDVASVTGATAGHDLIISAIGPAPTAIHGLVDATRVLIEGVERSGVKRLIAVGGPGRLLVKPGVQLLNPPEFPAEWRPIALEHCEALDLYRASRIDWTNVSPAALIEPGTRTGRYRIGGDELLVDAEGRSRISIEDFAVAILDGAERRQHIRLRITVAY